jgi:hypothetical protein
MTNERHEKALEAACGKHPMHVRPEILEEMFATYLEAMDAVIVPREAAFDTSLNDLGWDMNKFLQDGGAQFDGRVFNNMKGFLKTAIEKWISKAPNHFTNGE